MPDIQTKLALIVGARGTGKTTVCQKILQAVNVPRKLVVSLHLDDWKDYPRNELKTASDLRFTGIQHHLPLKSDITMERLKYLRNAALLFDDARMFLPAKTADELVSFYIALRHYGVHFFFVAHFFEQIPPQLFGFATEMILFKTNTAIGNERLSKLNDPEKFLDAKKRVDLKAETKPHTYEIIKL